jgi:hypothetical protein
LTGQRVLFRPCCVTTPPIQGTEDSSRVRWCLRS